MELYSTVIELLQIEPRDYGPVTCRVLGLDLSNNNSYWYSVFDKKANPQIGDVYIIKFALSTPDYKNRHYKNIKKLIKLKE